MEMPKKPKPATERQIALIKKLGGDFTRGMTVEDASSIISGLIEEHLGGLLRHYHRTAA